MSGQIAVTSHSWREWNNIKPIWKRIFGESGASFFLSDDWVDTWLNVFGAELHPEILIFHSNDEPVGACVLVHRLCWLKCIPLRRVYLNCAGENESDGTAIEYNRLMCLPGHEQGVSSSLHQYLQQKSWDELILSGIERQAGAQQLQDEAFRVQTDERSCLYIDLAALRNKDVTYESTLSANARQQIRRSIRLYEESAGPVSLQQAATQGEAFCFFNELIALHQKSWQAKGEAGAFSSAKFRKFHERLIERTFCENRVHLLRVVAGDQVIGVLYNFYYGGRVYFYQSGFMYQDDKRMKPGLVTHYFAINHYRALPDALEYDLLAGDSQYKRSLANSQRMLEWVVVQKPTLRMNLVEALRGLRNKFARAG